MKKISALLVFLALSFCTAAVSSQQDPGSAYKPELIQYMIFAQVRHTKLWLAGNAANWELAEYEIDELTELLEKASKQVPDYKGFAVGKMIESIMSSSIEDVEKTIKAKDRSRFAVAYDKLTAACNNCHQSTNRPFIVIQRPTGPAFPNQSFHPRRN